MACSSARVVGVACALAFTVFACGGEDDVRGDAPDLAEIDGVPDATSADATEPEAADGDVSGPTGVTVMAYGAEGLEDPTLTALLSVTATATGVVIGFTGGAPTHDLAVMVAFDGDVRRVSEAVIDDRFDAAPVRYATSAGRGRFAVGAHMILATPSIAPEGGFVTLAFEDVPDVAKGIGPATVLPIVEVSEANQVGVTTFATIAMGADHNGDGAVDFRDAALLDDATTAALAALTANFGAALVAIRAYAGEDASAVAAIDPETPTTIIDDLAAFAPGPDGRMRGTVPVTVAATGFVGYRAVVAFGPDRTIDRLSEILAIATPLPSNASGTITGNAYVASDARVTLGDKLTVAGDLTILGRVEGDASAELIVTGDLELAPGGHLRVALSDPGEVDTVDGLALVVAGALSLDPGSLIETNGNLIIVDDPAYVPRDANGKLAAAGLRLLRRSRAYEAAPASAPIVPREVTPGAPEVVAILPIAGVTGDMVTFEAEIDPTTPTPSTWRWDFGGGTASATSSSPAPRLRLGEAGAYAGTLTLTKNGLTSSYQFVYLVFDGDDPRRSYDWNLCAGINVVPDPIEARDLATWIFTRAQLAGCFAQTAGGGGGGGGPGPGPRPVPPIVWNVAAPDVPGPPDKIGGCGDVIGRDGFDGRDLSLWVMGDFRLGENFVLQVLLGNGANGQNVAASCSAPSEDATARGGDGGVPGSFLLQSGLALGFATAIDVRGRIDLQLGSAGAGGNAAAYTANALARCPVGRDAGTASAIAGRGGNALYGAYGGGAPVGGPPGGVGPGAAGVIFWSQGPQNLANVRLHGRPSGGVGGQALAVGGRGGDGAGCGCDGGAGGFGSAQSGRGGDTTVELGPGGGGLTDVSVSAAGNGGPAVALGGHGGRGGACPVEPPMRGGQGGPGGWVNAIAGDPGQVFVGTGSDGTGVPPRGVPGTGGDGGDGCPAGDGGNNGVGTETALGVSDLVFGQLGSPGVDNCATPPADCDDVGDCADGNECTEDVCFLGECQHIGMTGADCGGGQIVPCVGGVCDGATCVAQALPDGTVCDLDDDACTGPNRCLGGQCSAGEDVRCGPASEQCQVNVCEPDTGACEPEGLDGWEFCSDGDPCTSFDRCEGGQCIGSEGGEACAPVCCNYNGYYYQASAPDCGFIVADESLCDDACCQFADGFVATSTRGRCLDRGGTTTSPAACDALCCVVDGEIRPDVRGNCDEVLDVELCDIVCCDAGVSVYNAQRGDCANVTDPARCEEICCDLEAGALIMMRGDCASAGGGEVAFEGCEEVCCKSVTGNTYTSTAAVDCPNDRLVGDPLCRYYCCESDGQRALTIAAECEGELLDVEACDPQCCAIGTGVFGEAPSCELVGAEPAAAGDCDKVCCLLDGKHEWRTAGICDFLDGEAVDKSFCTGLVCCVRPGGASVEFASDCQTEALPLDGGGAACSADVDCDDGDPCTDDVCSGECGFCVNAPRDCDDHVDCTVDACLGGECTHVLDHDVCGDSDACALRFCDASMGCQDDPIIDCDDDNACTTDACNVQSGCSHRNVTCPSAPVCQRSSCDRASGCELDALPDGTACGVDRVCNQGECVSGLTTRLGDCWTELTPGQAIDVGTWVSGGSGTTTVTLAGGSTGYTQAFTVAGTTLNVGATGPKGYGGDVAARVRIQRGGQAIEVLAVARFAGPDGAIGAQLTGFGGSGPTGVISEAPELSAGDTTSAFINAEGAGWVCDASSCAYCWASRISVVTSFTGLVIGGACSPACDADQVCLLEGGASVCRDTDAAETATCAANDTGNLFVVGRGCVWKSVQLDATYADPSPGSAPGTYPVDLGVPFTIGPAPVPASGCGFLAMQYEFTASPPLGCQARLSAGGDDVLGLHILTILRGD